MYFTTSDNIKIAYSDIGKGHTILLMTGYSGYQEIWNSQIKVLSENGFRVINIDKRNHGKSERTSVGLRMSRQGKDIAELMDYLGLTHVSMMGNSMGASIIWAYCSLYGSCQIDSIISVDQSPKMINDSTWQYGFKGLNWGNFREIDERLGLMHTTFKHIDNQTFKLVKQAQMVNPFDNQLNISFLIDHTFQDWRDVITQIDKPILFIAGRESTIWDYHHAHAAAKLCKNGQFVVIKQAGHIVMAEQSSQFNKIMLSFLLNNL